MSVLLETEARLAELGVKPFHLPLGPLAPVVEGGFSAMNKGDWVVVGPRERIGAVLRGCPVERLVDLHAGARPYKVTPSTAAPGTRALHAVGLALASSRPVLCFLGVASAASGSFYEGLNAAVLTGAPVTFVVAMPVLTDDAPVSRQVAAEPSAIAKTMGLKTSRVKATVSGVKRAVKQARGVPSLVQVNLA
ncbi:MAG: hypothetical protein QGG40_03465 [Myxococcota bacterium]|nr:hypothetical protein [Myxococcota bacterium]